MTPPPPPGGVQVEALPKAAVPPFRVLRRPGVRPEAREVGQREVDVDLRALHLAPRPRRSPGTWRSPSRGCGPALPPLSLDRARGSAGDCSWQAAREPATGAGGVTASERSTGALQVRRQDEGVRSRRGSRSGAAPVRAGPPCTPFAPGSPGQDRRQRRHELHLRLELRAPDVTELNSERSFTCDSSSVASLPLAIMLPRRADSWSRPTATPRGRRGSPPAARPAR